MARGDRSRPERTSEERERDRAERARRRAERSGELPAPPSPAEEPPAAELPAEPTGAPAAEEPLAGDLPAEPMGAPAAEEPLAGELPAEPMGAHAPEEPPAGELPAELMGAHAMDAPVEDGPYAPLAADEQGPVTAPVDPEPVADHPAPLAESDLAGQPAQETTHFVGTEQHAHLESPQAAAYEPAPATHLPGEAAHNEPQMGGGFDPATGHDVDAGAGEADPAGHDSGPQGAEASAIPEPGGNDDEDSETVPAGEGEGGEQGAGHVIPGLPPVEHPIPEAERLPPSPPRVGGRETPPMRRAFRRGAPATTAPLAEPRSHRSRTVATRLAAVVALAAVVVAVVVVVHSLSSSGSSRPPAGPPVVKVLIPEGKNRLQIAQIASAAGLQGDYRKETKHSPLLNPAHYGAPADTPDLEGFLFPATYDMDKGAPVGRLVEEQLTAFQENFGSEAVARAKALGVTPYQLLTVASMVEREAQVPSDRAKIAAVIYNRLKAGMPLGIDASIYYAVEMAKGIPTYTHELTESQLHIESPYNTRLHTGLPPTPISNPGAASIYAAAHPAHVAYLYYVAGADGCGEQVFSDNQGKFEEDVAAYEAAKRANGGHPPVCKHG